MRAVVYDRFGGPEVLHLTELPDPTAGPGQVVIEVAAWSVNPFDCKVRVGAFAGDKPFGPPRKVGRDLAGVVVAAGDGAELGVGSRVVGSVAGASAELVAARASALVTVPDGLDLRTAAGIPGAGTAAIRALALSGATAGQTLLVHAAAGGVGSFLTQLAVRAGITVIGAAGPANQDYLRELGAIPVLYGDGWSDRVGPGRVDAVVDLAGRGVAEQSLRVVRPGGRILTLVDFAASGPGIVSSDGSEPGFEHALTDAVDAVATGRVRIAIDRVFPLADYADAHRLSEAGHVRGKIILVP